MKFKLVLCFLVSVFLGSCAAQPLRFHKAGASQQEFERDRYECNLQTRMANPVPAYPQFPNIASTAAYVGAMSGMEDARFEFYQRCMWARGWQPASD